MRLNSEGVLDTRLPSEVGILAKVIASHGVIAARYNENVTTLTNETLPSLSALCETLREGVRGIELFGEQLVKELVFAERNVQDAWAAYDAVAQESLRGGGSAEVKAAAAAAAAAAATEGGGGEKKKKGGSETTFVDPASDVWLVEMKYRLSVILLQRCWTQCGAGLSGLFAQMKELEFNRRLKLKELMVEFLSAQE